MVLSDGWLAIMVFNYRNFVKDKYYELNSLYVIDRATKALLFFVAKGNKVSRPYPEEKKK
jgi:hypothetical protein